MEVCSYRVPEQQIVALQCSAVVSTDFALDKEEHIHNTEARAVLQSAVNFLDTVQQNEQNIKYKVNNTE